MTRQQLLPTLLMTLTGCSLAPFASRSPDGGGATAVRIPVPETLQLSSGIPVWLVESRAVPLVTVSLIVRAGSTADPRGKEGLAGITANMLDEGAGGRDAIQIAEEIEYLGGELSIAAQKEHIEINVEVLKRNLDAALDVLADVVLRPNFQPADWDRVKALTLGDLAQRREEARDVARVASERVYYGEGHPYAHPVEGYEASVKALGLDDARGFYRARFRPSSCAFVVAGDVAAADLQGRLEKRFGGWRPAGEGAPAAPAPAAAQGTGQGAAQGTGQDTAQGTAQGTAPRLVIVDKPDAPQTEIRVLLPAPAHGSPELPPLSLANMILGGTFTSRLISNLRERHGFTYGASSMILSRGAAGHLVVGTAVHTEKTGPALVEICRELRGMETGALSAEELQKSRSTHASRAVEALESIDSTLRLYTQSAALGRPPGERQELQERLARATDAEITAASGKRYRWDQATVVLVGDRKAIDPQLAALRQEPPRDLPGVKAFTLPRPETRGREGEAEGGSR